METNGLVLLCLHSGFVFAGRLSPGGNATCGFTQMSAHNFDVITLRCRGCGISYAATNRSAVDCKPAAGIIDSAQPEKSAPAPLTGDALWQSIVESARGS